MESETASDMGAAGRCLDVGGESIFGRLAAVEWFARCGSGEPVDVALPARIVANRAEFIHGLTDPYRENMRVELRNRFTEYLHDRHRDMYSGWNDLVAQARPQVMGDHGRSTCDTHAWAGGAFGDQVRWDVLNVIMEHADSARVLTVASDASNHDRR